MKIEQSWRKSKTSFIQVNNNTNESTAVHVGNPTDDEVTFESLDVAENAFTKTIKKVQDAVYGAWDACGTYIIWGFLFCLLVLYLVYFGHAMDHEFGSEPSVRLLWYTIVALIIIIACVVYQIWTDEIDEFIGGISLDFEYGWVVNIVALIALYLAVIIYIIVDMVHLTKEYYNLVSLGGMCVYVLLFYITSYSPAHVNWRAVLWGLGMQFVFALLILRWNYGYEAFKWIGDRVTSFLSHSDAGAEFLFGSVFREHFFAFSVLPVIIYFSTIISVLYYLGVMQAVVKVIGWGLQALMGTTAGESLNAAGNIFIGQSLHSIWSNLFIHRVSIDGITLKNGKYDI